MGWPSGEAAACKAVNAGSIPVPTSLGPPQRACKDKCIGAIGAAVARFPDTEEVTGSIPVSPTKPPLSGGFCISGGIIPRGMSGERSTRFDLSVAIADAVLTPRPRACHDGVS